MVEGGLEAVATQRFRDQMGKTFHWSSSRTPRKKGPPLDEAFIAIQLSKTVVSRGDVRQTGPGNGHRSASGFRRLASGKLWRLVDVGGAVRGHLGHGVRPCFLR